MLANVHFSAIQGIVAHPVEVEVNDGYGQTITVTVGLPEFKRNVLETMRQPLEEGTVTISRAAGSMTFPSAFILIAAMNPTMDGKMPGESSSSPREIQN